MTKVVTFDTMSMKALTENIPWSALELILAERVPSDVDVADEDNGRRTHPYGEQLSILVRYLLQLP